MRAATFLGAAINRRARRHQGCGRGNQQPPHNPPACAASAAHAAAKPSAPIPKRLTLTYDKTRTAKPVVGTAVDATG